MWMSSFLFVLEEDLEKEIDYILRLDQAYKTLNDLLDWPAHRLELFIRVVQQNEGVLSKTKQDSHFDWMTTEEIQQAEKQVAEAFQITKT